MPGHRPADAARPPRQRGEVRAMTRIRSRRRSEAQLIADLDDILRPGCRIGVLGAAWRWRYELGLAAGVTLALAALLRVLGTEWTVIAMSALAGALAPPWPPWATAAAWRVITPHRLRSGCAQARIQSRCGRLPLVLRTTSTPFGERVRLWCPAGTSAEDLRSARTLLQAACWAADVRLTQDEHHAHIVTVDVIRRRLPAGSEAARVRDAGDSAAIAPAGPRTPAPGP